MILEEFSRMLVEEFGALSPVLGDAARRVRGLGVEEHSEGWLEKDEVAITSREDLDDAFLRGLREAGSPAVLWRREGEPPLEAVERARGHGIGLFMVSPEVPLRRLLSVFSGDDGLLLLSHGAGRALLESVVGEGSIGDLTARIFELLDRPVVVEDPVGRFIASAPSSEEPNALRVLLEEYGLRASKRSGVE